MSHTEAGVLLPPPLTTRHPRVTNTEPTDTRTEPMSARTAGTPLVARPVTPNNLLFKQSVKFDYKN